MKITIAGAGEIGTYLAKMLNLTKHDIIVIDNDKSKLSQISSHFDLLTVYGSASSISILNESEITHCDLFIAVTRTQETNIMSCILAKKLGAKKTIARIDNREYIEEKNNKIITDLGIDSLVYPEILASNEIIQKLKNSYHSINFASGKLILFKLRIENDSPYINLNLIEIHVKYPGIKARIVAISRKNETIIPSGLNKLHLDDVIYIISTPEEIKKILKISKQKEYHMKNIMILGGSRIGVKTARKLEKNCNVKLVEKCNEKSILISDSLNDTLILNDEGRTAEFLLDEGIQKNDVFIAVTGNSEINILSCLLAKKLGAKKTIAEIENNDYLKFANTIGIDIIFNKKFIAASHIYFHTTNAEVSDIQCLAETNAELMEFIVHENSKITKKQLKYIKFPKEAIIGGIVRGGESFIADGNTKIEPNDIVVVFTVPNEINNVAKFFK